MSTTYQTVLEARSGCGADVVMFRFSRPKGYEFKAGQWFRLTLETADGDETKTFSHSSAPQDDSIELTTRVSSSAFKQTLDALAPGDGVSISGPGGRLALPEGTTRAAFLVGGVGVTPVRSILREAVASGVVFDDAVLVYGNREPSCAPYLDEFVGMRNSGVRVVAVFESADSAWTGERGFITADLVSRHVDPSDGRPFMVAGPPPMVSVMQGVLDAIGVEPDRRLVEWFGRPE